MEIDAPARASTVDPALHARWSALSGLGGSVGVALAHREHRHGRGSDHLPGDRAKRQGPPFARRARANKSSRSATTTKNRWESKSHEISSQTPRLIRVQRACRLVPDKEITAHSDRLRTPIPFALSGARREATGAVEGR